jgi:hypothetical protein
MLLRTNLFGKEDESRVQIRLILEERAAAVTKADMNTPTGADSSPDCSWSLYTPVPTCGIATDAVFHEK